MNEIITLGTSNIGDNLVQIVNARDLHARLNIGKDFSSWAKVQIRRAGLEENVDFITYTQKGVGGKFDSVEYRLTLDAAKHVAMMSNTAKGKEVRDYFIAAEKAFRRDQQLSLETQTRLKIEHQYANSVEYKLGELVKEVINPNAVSRLDLAVPWQDEPPKKPKMTKDLLKFLSTPCRPLTQMEFATVVNLLSRS